MNTLARTLTAMWLCVWLVSCALYTPQYDISSKSEYDIRLREVEASSQVKDMFGDGRIVRADSADIQGYVFENDMIRMTWVPTEISLAFTLENKTDDSLRIMWKDAVYIDVEGVAATVTHSGVKYAELNYTDGRVHRPSVVLSKGSMSDMVLPRPNVRAPGGMMLGGHVTPLLPGDAESYLGKTIRVLLPLKVEAAVVEYTFVFNIDGLIAGK